MRTAVDCQHIIGERHNVFAIAATVLQRDLRDRRAARHRKVNDLVVQNRLTAVVVRHKFRNTALVVELFTADGLRIALIGQRDLQTGVQKRLLAHTLFEAVVIVYRRIGEDLRVRLKADVGTGFLGIRDNRQLAGDLTFLKALMVGVTLTGNLHLQPLGQRVYHRRADAMQTAGHLVTAAAELTTGVQDGQNHRHGGQTELFVQTDRDTTAVVTDANNITGQNFHLDVTAIAGQRLVHRVIHDLIHQVVQTAFTGRADVHTRTLTHRIQTL